MLQAARSLKHRIAKRYRWRAYEATEPIVQAWHRRFPVRYDPADFDDTFLVHDCPLTRETTEPVPRRIFCFWTGDNDVPEVRRRSLESMQEVHPEIPVVLVTPDDLPAYVLPEHPLHDAYEGLSFVHRSDYLRCYFLNFHGGGYADIKPFRTSWSPAFDRMDASDAWLMGYRNPIRLMTPNFTDPRLQRWMVRTSDIRLGQAAYIARPNTPITEEWWRQVNVLLDDVAEALVESPGETRAHTPLGDYPLHWNGLLAQVIDPLTVKHSSHLLYESSLFYDHTRPYL
jgi:hypothetical protein